VIRDDLAANIQNAGSGAAITTTPFPHRGFGHRVISFVVWVISDMRTIPAEKGRSQ
jgi:hypothetical protein